MCVYLDFDVATVSTNLPLVYLRGQQYTDDNGQFAPTDDVFFGANGACPGAQAAMPFRYGTGAVLWSNYATFFGFAGA